MVREMFGMGGTEIIVILIVALLFLGPDKLPEAARQISKGIRDIKKQSRVLQRTIEDDEHIGGAIRDLKSALRGEDEPIRPKPIPPVTPPAALPEGTSAVHTAIVAAASHDPAESLAAHSILGPDGPDVHDVPREAPAVATPSDDRPKLTLPATAGEPDRDVPNAGAAADDHVALAALVKQAPNTIPRSAPAAPAAPAAVAPSAPEAPEGTQGPGTSEPTRG
jgi:sec-independent protein translocase protein TatB